MVPGKPTFEDLSRIATAEPDCLWWESPPDEAVAHAAGPRESWVPLQAGATPWSSVLHRKGTEGKEGPLELVSSWVEHEGGALARTELVAVVARLLCRLESKSGRPDSPIVLQMGVGSDFFGEIAKFRALRLLASGLLRHSGSTASPPLLLHASTGSFCLSEIDSWNNLVRCSMQALAAGLGGVDSLDCQGLRLPIAEAESLRLGVQCQQILESEAHIGHNSDPARGSGYLEQLTLDLARSTWENVRRLCDRTELEDFLEAGGLAERVASEADQRRRSLARRERTLVGVNVFPPELETDGKNEPAVGVGETKGIARDFERLRTRARRLADLGSGPLPVVVEDDASGSGIAHLLTRLLGGTVAGSSDGDRVLRIRSRRRRPGFPGSRDRRRQPPGHKTT